jgi:uncharacterized protein (DUF736 family)
MYRALNQWEEAYRVAQQHAPPQIQEQVMIHHFLSTATISVVRFQVVVAWSNSLEDDSAAARVLSTHNALEAGIKWAARGGRWARALALCHLGAPHLEAPVRAQMAAQLEDEGKVRSIASI